MKKRDLILDTMEALLTEKKGDSCSVSDIAQRAGIAKGGLYYYFKSKEEVFDALVERTYQTILQECQMIAMTQNEPALVKLKHVYEHYRSAMISHEFDSYLHLPQNALIHQKSLAMILTSLSSTVARIIEQGNEEGSFHCAMPLELSEIVVSTFCFLLDQGIFPRTLDQYQKKLTGLAYFFEQGLGIPEGSIDFFC